MIMMFMNPFTKIVLFITPASWVWVVGRGKFGRKVKRYLILWTNCPVYFNLGRGVCCKFVFISFLVWFGVLVFNYINWFFFFMFCFRQREVMDRLRINFLSRYMWTLVRFLQQVSRLLTKHHRVQQNT